MSARIPLDLPVDALAELEAEVARHLPERDKEPFRGDDALRHATWLLRQHPPLNGGSTPDPPEATRSNAPTEQRGETS